MEKILNRSIAQMKKMNTTQKKYNRYAQKHKLFTSYTVVRLLQKEYRQILNS